ncbi:hypothetical protein MAN88_22260 [Microcystis aeruginosa]|nr:hypothetical protein MAN88_22260 [Microcystis aeruginosa]
MSKIPLPELTLPSPPPTLNKLPPVSYRQEIAHITLKTGELQQIETKITQQKQKISQLLALPSAPLIKGGLRGDPVNVASLTTFVTIDSQPLPPVETIIELDILAAVKRTAIPKPHDLGFCFFPLRGSAPALTDLLCSGLMVARQTDTASPAAKIFLLALISRSW